jgi:hypothetical protein
MTEYSPWIALVCITYFAIWSECHRRKAEREVRRLESQTVDLITSPRIALGPETDMRTLRRIAGQRGFILHRKP